MATEYGGLAQLGEHLPCKQGVESSNLLISIRIQKEISCWIRRFTSVKQKMYIDNYT